MNIELILQLSAVFIISLIVLVRAKLKHNTITLLFSSVIATFMPFILIEYFFFLYIYQNYSTFLVQKFGEISNVVLFVFLPGLFLFITFAFIGNFLGSQILESESLSTSLSKAVKSILHITAFYLVFVLFCGITGGIVYFFSTNPQSSELINKYPILGLLTVVVSMLPFGMVFGLLYYFATKPIKSIHNSRKKNIKFNYVSKSDIKKLSLEFRFNEYMDNLFKTVDRQASEDFVPTTPVSAKFEYTTVLMDRLLKMPKDEIKSFIDKAGPERMKIIFTNIETAENMSRSFSSTDEDYQEFALSLFTLKSAMTSDLEKFMKKEISMEEIGNPRKLKIEVEYEGNGMYDLVFWNRKI